MPKVNMYQSLHTRIVAGDGDIFEVQIRTEKMDEVAERGVAAHWRYKEAQYGGQEVEQKEIEEQLHWFKDFSMMSDEESDDPLEYMNAVSYTHLCPIWKRSFLLFVNVWMCWVSANRKSQWKAMTVSACPLRG